MITIMPALEVLKAFSDKNITSPPAIKRVEAFSLSTELMAEANVSILIPSQLYGRIGPRLNDDHKAAFETLYRIDYSAKTIPNFSVQQAINLIADAESKARGVIILTDNPSAYPCLHNQRIKVIKPEEFISRVTIVRSWRKRGVIGSTDDMLWMMFFKE